MRTNPLKLMATVFFLCSLLLTAEARTGRFRCMWREDPATSMVVGWDQISGGAPVFYYDTEDHGQNINAYRMSMRPDRIVPARGMNNHFVRLTGLRPNTTYFFIIRDNEGVSRRLSFRTAPANPATRLSIIAGGDSRNYRDARINANVLVSKLRPNFILFGGDFTGGDTAPEWREWLDDWQHTISSDGRLFPIVVARGNHEMSSASLIEIFDIPNPDAYYGFTFGGNLLRLYSLNTLIASGGDQRDWLERDLRASSEVTWKVAQYHHPMRPHTGKKAEKDELVINWAPLFYQYGINMVVECDAHVVKSTWPVRPSNEPGSYEGFIRDDAKGIVFVGEGGWGAPLRSNNDDKPWTRNSGSFNQFKWIFVDQNKIEVRTVKTDVSAAVREVDPQNVFKPPIGLVLWTPSNGDVVTINKPGTASSAITGSNRPVTEVSDLTATLLSNGVVLRWSSSNEHPAMVYEIQRSTDGGQNYSPIETRRAQGGAENSYSYHDAGSVSIRGGLDYRLKCVAPNAPPTFFKVRVSAPPLQNTSISTVAPAPAKIMPETSSGDLRVVFSLPGPANVSFRLLNQNRRQLLRKDFPGLSTGQQMKIINIKQLNRGNYLLLIEANNKIIEQYQVLKRF